jgi:outer membrane protein assembly factor BamB
MRIRRLLLAAVLGSGAATLSATDVLFEGVDTARTGWVKNETVFTPANVGATKLLWRVQLNSTPRAMHNLFPPLIAENVQTAQGPLEVGLVAGITDDLFAIDVANGQVIWRRRFENRLANQALVDNVLCPGGQTAAPALVQVSPGKYTVYALSWDGRLHQINLGDGENVAPPEKFIPGNGKPYALNY